MTIAFMVLAAPRSATTWLSNLLSTDTSLCMHDPLLEHKPTVLDRVTIPGVKIGMADTAALVYPEWLERHPAKKIVLWRDPEEINASLRALGLREIHPRQHAARVRFVVETLHVPVFHWSTIFFEPTARKICKYFGVPFIEHRFNHSRLMNIQPQFSRLPIGKEAVQELVQRIAKEVLP